MCVYVYMYIYTHIYSYIYVYVYVYTYRGAFRKGAPVGPQKVHAQRQHRHMEERLSSLLQTAPLRSPE